MNNRIIIILIVFCSMQMASCEKFLVRTPYEYLSIEGFYETERDVELAVNGCYNGLITIKRSNELVFNENMSDNATFAFTNQLGTTVDAMTPSLLMPNASNTYLAQYWKATYALISRTNEVLANMDVVLTEEKKNSLAGQARFIRGMAYFNLVRHFGGVPLVLKPIKTGDESRVKDRDDVDAVYASIIDDLQTSVSLLTNVSFNSVAEYGRANKWAAKALLAKVLLTRGDKPGAKVLLRDVYTNSGFKLAANYGDLFAEALESTIAPQEVLFSVRHQAGGVGLGNNFSTIAANSILSAFGSNMVFYSNSLFKAYLTKSDTSKDTRYKVTCNDVPGQQAGPLDLGILKRYPAKCVGLIKSGTEYKTVTLTIANDGGLDWPELRFADVILMLSETEGFTTEGLRLLNEVRKRAKAPEYTTIKINDLFGGNFQEAVLNERRLELAFENDRLFDLKRMGDAYATAHLYDFFQSEPAFDATYFPVINALKNQVVIGGKIESWRLLLPIPLNEVLRSSVIKQNPGYAQ